ASVMLSRIPLMNTTLTAMASRRTWILMTNIGRHVAMIIYKDFLTGDELFSDAFPIKKINDHIWEVEGKMIKVKEGVDDALIGANPSAEEGGEAVEDGVVSVINVVYSHQLEELPFNNK
ncbi:hypothetical protein FTX61_28685, partial [Nitriliruptoraceae bacterium ZYF776]|nr:hypothetical protein [Profundirhabdus halotolerans]